MAFRDREYWENRIGKPKDFIINFENRGWVKNWAIAAGFEPLHINGMSTADLANLYHEFYGRDKNEDGISKPNEKQRIAAEIFVRVLESIQTPGFNVELTRQITQEEIKGEACRPALYAIAAQEIEKAVAAMPPRRYEIVTPTATVLVEGLMHYKAESVIRAAAIGHPIMMVGPAGCGKTKIGEHVSLALQLPFYITSTINDTHELTGFVDGYGKYHSTPFRKAFEFGGVWVADEIDAWDASALLAANSALANGYANFPDTETPIARNPNFRMVATANTYGSGADRVYVGRNELDAASLDRFAVISVDYDLNLEQMFAAGESKWLDHVWSVRKKVETKKIRHVVSSRAIAMGSAALRAGFTWNEVEEMYLFKGMSETDRSKIK